MRTLLPIFCMGLLYSLGPGMGSKPNLQAGSLDDPLPRKCDTATSFENIFTKLGVFPTILNSSASIEIRVYRSRFPPISGRIDIIRIYQDSSIHEKYTYDNMEIAVANPMRLDSQGITLGKKEVAQKVAYKLIPHTQTTLQRLIEKLQITGFFNMPDQSKLLDSLKKKKVEVNNPCAGGATHCQDRALILFETKVSNCNRNFNILQLDYAAVNKTMRIFDHSRKIREAFNEILLL